MRLPLRREVRERDVLCLCRQLTPLSASSEETARKTHVTVPVFAPLISLAEREFIAPKLPQKIPPWQDFDSVAGFAGAWNAANQNAAL